MKTSTRKMLFLIGGFLLLLQLIGSIITFVVVMTSPELINFLANLYNFNYSEVVFFYNAFKIIFIIFEVINVALTVTSMIFYFKKSKYTEEEFETKKTSNLVWSVIVIIFVGLIPGILGVVASVVTSNDEKPKVVNEEQKTQTAVAEPKPVEEPELQAKIAKLKQLKENGSITEEEYEKLFSSLIK